MDEELSAQALAWQITWRTMRQMFAGIGQGSLGALLLILTDALPRGWKPAAAVALVAAAQIRLVVRSVRHMVQNWRAHEQTCDELYPLMRLEGFVVERRRADLKKLEDACFFASFAQIILIGFGLWVLYECVLILPRLGIGITFPEWVPAY